MKDFRQAAHNDINAHRAEIVFDTTAEPMMRHLVEAKRSWISDCNEIGNYLARCEELVNEILGPVPEGHDGKLSENPGNQSDALTWGLGSLLHRCGVLADRLSTLRGRF